MRSLSILHTTLAVCRLAPNDPLPEWAFRGPFICLTRTPEELSIVCAEEAVPSSIHREGGWQALKVEGPLDFSLTGILADLAGVLAQAGISIFAISTFDTDYLLLRKNHMEQAVLALRQAGYQVNT